MRHRSVFGSRNMNAAFGFRFLVALALLLGLPLLPRDQAAAQGVTTQRTCGDAAFYDASTSGATQLVPAPAGNQTRAGNTIFICGYAITTSVGNVNVGLVYGTGTNCGTGTTKITPAWQFSAVTGIGGIVDGGSVFRGLVVPAGNNLCINANTGVAVQAIVYFDNSPL